MEFDPHIALSYAAACARPRLVGSGEERVVAQEISLRLEHFGYRVHRQRFAFQTAHSAAVAGEVAVCLALLLAALALHELSPGAAIVPAALLIGVIALAMPVNRAMQQAAVEGRPHRLSRIAARLGRRYVTDNLIAAQPSAPDDPGVPHIYLVAHYDSKSQRIPIVIRVGCFMLAMAGCFLFAGLVVLSALGVAPAITSTAATAMAGVTLIAGAPLLFLDVGNASPGAIDNASGVGTVLHLAECLSQRDDLRDRLRVTILISGAEELGVMGAVAHVLERESELRREAQAGGVCVLNFDGVGVNADVRLVCRRAGRLAAAVDRAASELGFNVRPFSMVGLSYDHVPFAERGFDAVSLIGIGRATWAVHTPRDTVDRLHVRGFDQAGRLALKVMESLAIH